MGASDGLGAAADAQLAVDISGMAFDCAERYDKGLRNGLYFYHGILTNKSIADWFDLSYRDINLLIF